MDYPESTGEFHLLLNIGNSFLRLPKISPHSLQFPPTDILKWTYHTKNGKIIAHLKLIFMAERPPPSQFVQKELLMAAEERGEYH
jgi:hypothetical protein